MNTRVEFSKSAWRRADSSGSVRMSMSQPVSCEASRTFCPRRPIASESWLLVSGTTTSIRSRSSSITTLATSAGANALTTKVAISGDHGMMSIFSPCSSLTTACVGMRGSRVQADVDEVMSQLLASEGFTSVEDLALVDQREIAGIEGFDEDTAGELQTRARDYLAQIEADLDAKRLELGVED